MLFFDRTTLFTLLSLLPFTSSFAQSTQKQVDTEKASKNRSAQVIQCHPPTGISVRGSWDLYTTASFTYWNPYQENMELGIIADNSDPTIFILNGNFKSLDFDYQPGFTVGIGTNVDRGNWDLYLQYTWFRGTDDIEISLNPAGNNVLIPKWEIPDVASPSYFGGKEKWRLQMDLLDFEMGSDYCITTALSFRTFFGARAAWIRQKISVEYLNETTGLLLNHNVFAKQRSRSWAIGPRAGLQSNWMLGKEIRFYGNASGDLLFTQYTTLNIDQRATTSAGAVATSSLYHTGQNNLNYLRGHFALDLGFGWGRYIHKNATHIDLSAEYGFQIFLDQNMFRFFLDDQYLATSFIPNGNLYIHGLKSTLRLDF